MTTGRINQVTIVRRGWPPPLLRGGELVTGGTRQRSAAFAQGQTTPACTAPARPAADAAGPAGASAFPLSVPQAAVGAHRALLRAKCGLNRPGGVLAWQVQLFSVPCQWVSPVALLNFGQRPAVFRAQPLSTAPKRRRFRAAWLSVSAVACTAPGVDRRHEPPLPR